MARNEATKAAEFQPYIQVADSNGDVDTSYTRHIIYDPYMYIMIYIYIHKINKILLISYIYIYLYSYISNEIPRVFFTSASYPTNRCAVSQAQDSYSFARAVGKPTSGGELWENHG